MHASLIVLRSGEPGIGKSRLLDEFPSHWSASSALMVLRGGATRGEGLPPYLPR
jgi:predicted ATP-dependent serine protease